MYICEDCGKVLNEEDLPIEEERHCTLGGEYLGTERFIGQCSCGGEFVEAILCRVCGEEYINPEIDICKDCLSYYSTQSTALEMGDDIKEEYEINGFLASVFTPSEVHELLCREFDALPKHMKDKYIYNYCNEDTYFFAEWLEERNKNVDLH